MHPASSGAARARLASLALLAALALTSLLAIVSGQRGPVATGILAFVLLAPLALPLPGLLQRRRRTFGWATLCITPHLLFALTEVVANPALRVLAALMLLAGLGLAVALVAYLRVTRE